MDNERVKWIGLVLFISYMALSRMVGIGLVRQPRERRGVDRCVWCARYVG